MSFRNVSCMTREVNLEDVSLRADACRQMVRGIRKTLIRQRWRKVECTLKKASR
jgi:hypothetical protein